jgi:hypothetical protein
MKINFNEQIFYMHKEFIKNETNKFKSGGIKGYILGM